MDGIIGRERISAPRKRGSLVSKAALQFVDLVGTEILASSHWPDEAGRAWRAWDASGRWEESRVRRQKCGGSSEST
jgi:hypothetical protein